MQIKEIMSSKVMYLKDSNTIEDAMKLFAKEDIDVIFINSDNSFNYVTKKDLISFILKGCSNKTLLLNVNYNDYEKVNENTNIRKINKIEKEYIAVIDNKGKPIGIVKKDEVNRVKQMKILSFELDAVIESSYDGIYITDGQANTLKVNKAYERITGINRKEMLGKNMKELVKKGYISQSVTLLVLKRQAVTTIEQEFSTRKKVLATGTPIFDEEGNILMVVTNIRDVTELVELRSQLEINRELTEKYYSTIEEMKKQITKTDHMIAEDEKILELLEIAKRVSQVDITVLLLGETGVGKEEVARFIHQNSKRRDKQLIKVNCGAIPETLIESELFGYEKGAFTGANKEGKRGLFELAEGGTLLLDEIGELPLDLQVKLLRALQEQEIVRIGGVKPIKINVRILAATNRNLEKMVKENLFREDLYYRLNVIPLHIPPLRQRKKDIVPLIYFFTDKINKKYNLHKRFSSEAFHKLINYDWPGNVRELRNIVERTAVITSTDEIQGSDLPEKISISSGYVDVDIHDEIVPLKDIVGKIEKKLIERAFEKFGNVRDAAKALGIDASTYVRKRKKYQKNTSLHKYN
ncbi:sigma 54-interacting transcriptional regulator [Serpentinicella alkaliphila]|uniref:HTH-type transcriptional regulatory protein TyrR n=1 Tax=Serpentinicella alkaliphila TaxID=1734049 RepID=A0A4R2TDI1_9FIRM|nr:sigma 54-interacting transcriptional regulator [Serpentinicella alkaliphila]QUH26987.1 sigma 54-interacting transcriptional regulator [Serpentinicella alkaliphila]TCQ00586.1 PAS domain S-box-containing protein [Serpentinicella alkaliphila]